MSRAGNGGSRGLGASAVSSAEVGILDGGLRSSQIPKSICRRTLNPNTDTSDTSRNPPISVLVSVMGFIETSTGVGIRCRFINVMHGS